MTEQKKAPEVSVQRIFILTRKASRKGGDCSNCQEVIQSPKISEQIYLWPNSASSCEDRAGLPFTLGVCEGDYLAREACMFMEMYIYTHIHTSIHTQTFPRVKGDPRSLTPWNQ